MRSYGALLRLPRAEVARRFGQVVPEHLDTLLGRRADVVVPMRLAERFRQHLEWPYAIASSTALLFPARRLLMAAAHWLAPGTGLWRAGRADAATGAGCTGAVGCQRAGGDRSGGALFEQRAKPLILMVFRD